jgi:hypothetical protein
MIFRRTSCKGACRTIRATVPMLMGTVVVSALIINISDGFFDPRVRYQEGRHCHDGHLPSEGKGQGRIDA